MSYARQFLENSTTLDDIKHLYKMLQNAGADGQQAWKELQGGTMRYIRDKALSSVQMDSSANTVPSPSQLDRVVKMLDASGKLEFVFGKGRAEKVRTIRDLGRYLVTTPPGSVNHSNTTSVYLAMADVVVSSMTGVPAPVMLGVNQAAKRIKNHKLRKKVREAIGEE